MTQQSHPFKSGAPANILDHLWALLVRGKADRRHPFHQPALATTGPDNTPSVRTVVLRLADPDAAALHAHTDARAGKVGHLARIPVAAWHFYDPAAKLQIRATGPTQVLTEGERADQAWANTRLFSRRCYLAPNPPGHATDHPDPNLPKDLLRADPDAERSEEGRPNFAVVRTTIETLEWLHLAADGHTRGRFRRRANEWAHDYLAP